MHGKEFGWHFRILDAHRLDCGRPVRLGFISRNFRSAHCQSRIISCHAVVTSQLILAMHYYIVHTIKGFWKIHATACSVFTMQGWYLICGVALIRNYLQTGRSVTRLLCCPSPKRRTFCGLCWKVEKHLFSSIVSGVCVVCLTPCCQIIKLKHHKSRDICCWQSRELGWGLPTELLMNLAILLEYVGATKAPRWVWLPLSLFSPPTQLIVKVVSVNKPAVNPLVSAVYHHCWLAAHRACISVHTFFFSLPSGQKCLHLWTFEKSIKGCNIPRASLKSTSILQEPQI